MVNTHLNLLAGKIPNRENDRILVETGSMSDISGQHIRVEPRQQRRFGLRYCKISLYGGFVAEREEIGMETNTIILNLLAGKIPNRENSQYNSQNLLQPSLSGQLRQGEPRQLRPSGRKDRRISLEGKFMVGREGFEPSANGLKVRCSTAELTAHFD